jgi:hypothetical protein
MHGMGSTGDYPNGPLASLWICEFRAVGIEKLRQRPTSALEGMSSLFLQIQAVGKKIRAFQAAVAEERADRNLHMSLLTLSLALIVKDVSPVALARSVTPSFQSICSWSTVVLGLPANVVNRVLLSFLTAAFMAQRRIV